MGRHEREEGNLATSLAELDRYVGCDTRFASVSYAREQWFIVRRTFCG